MTEKRCGRCKESKPRTEFGSARNRPDGLYCYCRACARVAAQADYRKHRDRALAYAKERRRLPEVAASRHERAKRDYWENRESHLAHAKQWLLDNKDRRRAYIKGWNAQNRAKVREYQERYKRLKRGATEHTLTTRTWGLLQAVFRGKCVYCGDQPGREQDHVVPLSKGGRHSHDNVVPACRHCNATKLNNPAPQFWWTR